MKFGHTIKSEEAACLAGHNIEFADHFVDYKGLKKLLKKRGLGDTFFVDKLKREIAKVEAFFSAKETLFANTFSTKICPRVFQVGSPTSFLCSSTARMV
jgi:hypothetical protein